MYLVLIKFSEVFTRAAFMVGASYSLSLKGAGQFGIVAILVGLFAFAFNWERQVDIQRRYVDASPEILDRAVVAAIQFWSFNQLVLMPVFLAACYVTAQLSPFQLALGAVIVSCEHIANQTYQMALISRRYRRFLSIAVFRNAVVLLAVLPFILLAPSRLTLDYTLGAWAAGQLVCSIAILLIWYRVQQAAPHEMPFTFRERIFRQHRASFAHFQLGLVAIVALQLDRLTVGALLPLDQAGLYFRHVLIISFLYQFFNVAFYNRALPTLFIQAKGGRIAAVKQIIRRELVVIATLIGFGVGAAVAIDYAVDHAITLKYGLSIALVLILIAAALIRITADFLSAICHAQMREALILRAQVMTLMVGGAMQLILTWQVGIFGTAAACAATSLLYLLLVTRAVRSSENRKAL